VRFAPNKKLNNFFINIYKLLDGSNQFLQLSKLIEKLHAKFSKLSIRKLSEIRVKAHLHVLVITIKALDIRYSLNSLFISLQNQTHSVMRIVDEFKIKRAKSALPINKIKLIRNRIDIFQ